MALAKRIIPCLDVENGRVVKGVKFENIRDAGDPVEIARRYNEQGADEITFLDITATVEGRDTMLQTVERMASQVFIPLTVGGGVRTVEDIRKLLNTLVRSRLWWRLMPRKFQLRAKPHAGKFSLTVDVNLLV